VLGTKTSYNNFALRENSAKTSNIHFVPLRETISCTHAFNYVSAWHTSYSKYEMFSGYDCQGVTHKVVDANNCHIFYNCDANIQAPCPSVSLDCDVVETIFEVILIKLLSFACFSARTDSEWTTYNGYQSSVSYIYFSPPSIPGEKHGKIVKYDKMHLQSMKAVMTRCTCRYTNSSGLLGSLVLSNFTKLCIDVRTILSTSLY